MRLWRHIDEAAGLSDDSPWHSNFLSRSCIFGLRIIALRRIGRTPLASEPQFGLGAAWLALLGTRGRVRISAVRPHPEFRLQMNINRAGIAPLVPSIPQVEVSLIVTIERTPEREAAIRVIEVVGVKESGTIDASEDIPATVDDTPVADDCNSLTTVVRNCETELERDHETRCDRQNPACPEELLKRGSLFFISSTGKYSDGADQTQQSGIKNAGFHDAGERRGSTARFSGLA